MKNKNSSVILVALAMLFIACGTAPETEKEKETPEPKEATEEHDHSTDEIQLNEGKKWKVDDSMLVHIRNMESSILHFSLNEEYKSHRLGDSLQTNINLLTSNCTMKGAAHDELHKWLVPFMELVNRFSESEDQAEVAEYYQEIIRSFDTFNTFFE